ncbi:hypothetical protein C1Y40_05596 [Mycobacterium talmoniae]|uniref:Acyl-coenzyme A thioesterase THEM4 n=1 Tax=Mycobacterium talmoniae TaxID=1858794 RepID=A0A2S8BC63_9MYCO|nr:hypothetical protein C1Y40_05596 [Mycobacterium talmoniae]
MKTCPDTPAAGSTRRNPPPRAAPTTAGSSRRCATLQDRALAADAPDEVISEAADLVEKVAALLAPYEADEWSAPSGRRFDLPNRGNILTVPMRVEKVPLDGSAGRIRGTARFARYHLGRNGAVHGGALGLLFDSVLGLTSAVLTGSRYQRTAYLHVDYRHIVPIEKELQVDAGVDRIDGRKIFVSGRLCDGDTLLTEAQGLFVLLKPGQP